MKPPSCRLPGRGMLLAVSFLALSGGVAVRAQEQEPPILEPGGPGAASELTAEPRCSEDEIPVGQVLLQWRSPEQPGTQQLVQVTIFRDGFETGRVVTVRDLKPSQTQVLLQQVAGQALHRWRVLNLHPDGLVPSETARFEGPICVFDESEEGVR